MYSWLYKILLCMVLHILYSRFWWCASICRMINFYRFDVLLGGWLGVMKNVAVTFSFPKLIYEWPLTISLQIISFLILPFKSFVPKTDFCCITARLNLHQIKKSVFDLCIVEDLSQSKHRSSHLEVFCWVDLENSTEIILSLDLECCLQRTSAHTFYWFFLPYHVCVLEWI